MADQMRSRGSTALKKATPAQTIYQGSIADAAPTVIAPSSQRALKQARDRLLQEQKIQDQTLAREHNSEVLGERLQNQIKLAALQTEQLATRSEQKLEQEHELNSFKIDKNHKIAQAGLNVAGVAAAGTVKSANLNAINQLVQGVISLSSSYVKGDAAITEATNRIYGGLPEQQQSANVDRYQRAVRAAGAQAIDEVTPDPFLRDSGKEGNADIHEKLTDLKLTNLSLSNTIEAKLADFMDMNIPLEIGGRLISPLDGMATKEELNAYLHAAGTTIVLDFQKNGGQIKYGQEIGIRKSLEKGHNLQFQTWMPKILKLKTERRIKKAKDTFLSTVLLERTTPLAIAEGSDVHSMNKAIAALSEDNQIYFGGNRTQNNDAAVKQAIEALKEARRPDLLETLNNSSFVVTETHPDGQPNTQIGKKFGTEIIEAINDIERTEKTYQGFQINDIESAMYKELNNNGNPAQLLPADREAIVFKAAAKMRSVGEYGMEKARELEDKIVELRSLSTTELNESRYYQSIVEHDPSVTQQTLDNDLAIGALKPEEHKRLSTTLKKVNEGNRVNSRQLQGQVTAQKAKFKGAILKAVGLKQDANGNPIDPIVWDNGKVVPSEAKLDPWQVAIVIEQANQDINRLANTVPVAILNSGDEEKIAKHLNELYNTWWADNVANPDGRYGVIGEILSGSAMTEGTDTLPATLKDGIKDRLRELANNPTAINPQFRNAINSTKPIDWSESFRSLPGHKKNALARVIGEHRSSLIKEEFKRWRGDKAFTSQEMIEIVQYNSEGRVHPLLKQRSQVLGIPAATLYREQLQLFPEGSMAPPPPAPITGVELEPQAAADVLMMEYDIPVQTANILAGNIANQRVHQQPQNIDNLRQTVGLVQQDPIAWDIYKNPFSTERQLLRATKRWMPEPETLVAGPAMFVGSKKYEGSDKLPELTAPHDPIVDMSTQEQFNYVTKMARQSGAKFPELVAAQFLQESGGKTVSGKNNYFGLKGLPGQDTTTRTTQEDNITKGQKVEADFLNFDSPQDAVDYLTKLWYKNYKGYQGINNQQTIQAAAQALQDQGYATDPNYAKFLMDLVNQYSTGK